MSNIGKVVTCRPFYDDPVGLFVCVDENSGGMKVIPFEGDITRLHWNVFRALTSNENDDAVRNLTSRLRSYIRLIDNGHIPKTKETDARRNLELLQNCLELKKAEQRILNGGPIFDESTPLRRNCSGPLNTGIKVKDLADIKVEFIKPNTDLFRHQIDLIEKAVLNSFRLPWESTTSYQAGKSAVFKAMYGGHTPALDPATFWTPSHVGKFLFVEHESFSGEVFVLQQTPDYLYCVDTSSSAAASDILRLSLSGASKVKVISSRRDNQAANELIEQLNNFADDRFDYQEEVFIGIVYPDAVYDGALSVARQIRRAIAA